MNSRNARSGTRCVVLAGVADERGEHGPRVRFAGDRASLIVASACVMSQLGIVPIAARRGSGSAEDAFS